MHPHGFSVEWASLQGSNYSQRRRYFEGHRRGWMARVSIGLSMFPSPMLEKQRNNGEICFSELQQCHNMLWQLLNIFLWCLVQNEKFSTSEDIPYKHTCVTACMRAHPFEYCSSRDQCLRFRFIQSESHHVFRIGLIWKHKVGAGVQSSHTLSVTAVFTWRAGPASFSYISCGKRLTETEKLRYTGMWRLSMQSGMLKNLCTTSGPNTA